jgi:glyoxylase-like metal-dependent hydrolase (beta-lactamase superfamily II)
LQAPAAELTATAASAREPGDLPSDPRVREGSVEPALAQSREHRGRRMGEGAALGASVDVTLHSAVDEAGTMSVGVEESERRIFRFKVGSFDCVAINDGTFFYTADQYFGNADPGLLTAALAEHRLQRDGIPSPYTCLLVDTGEHVVVVDTGADRVAMRDFLPAGVEADVGRFAEGVAQAGVDVADVERVIVTHAHPDHIGGNTDAAGDAELLYISDAALHPLHLEHPDWCTVWEMDPDRALRSRRVLFDRAASTGALVLAFHFHPFPSLGRVQEARSGWMWRPVQ